MFPDKRYMIDGKDSRWKPSTRGIIEFYKMNRCSSNNSSRSFLSDKIFFKKIFPNFFKITQMIHMIRFVRYIFTILHEIFWDNIFLFPDLSSNQTLPHFTYVPRFPSRIFRTFFFSIFNHTLHIPLKIHIRNSWKIIQAKSLLCKIDTRFAPPSFKSREKKISSL